MDLLTGVWSGRFDEVDFLKRLYDLEAMPSFDYRHSFAAGVYLMIGMDDCNA
jgi:hypothetical protein